MTAKRALATGDTAEPKSKRWYKLALLALLAVVVTVGYMQFRDTLTLSNLAQREGYLRDLQAEHPVLVYGAAFLVYVVVTGLSLPGATMLTLTYGWYFGMLRGFILVSFASTTGATLAFLISRFLLRDSIERRFGDRLRQFNSALEREGPFFLFMLRLVPAIPFFVINAVMGLTPIRTRTFWWVSQLGMLAGTAVYVYAGSSVPSLQALADEGIEAVFTAKQVTAIAFALVLLGVFPLAIRWTLKLLVPSRAKRLAEPTIAHRDSPDDESTEGNGVDL